MTSLPSVPKFPTGALLNNSSRAQFYHEVFYPAFQTRVAHYHNSSELWKYIYRRRALEKLKPKFIFTEDLIEAEELAAASKDTEEDTQSDTDDNESLEEVLEQT